LGVWKWKREREEGKEIAIESTATKQTNYCETLKCRRLSHSLSPFIVVVSLEVVVPVVIVVVVVVYPMQKLTSYVSISSENVCVSVTVAAY